VHDYLVEFIRQQQGNELLAKLAQAQAELKQEKEAKEIIEKAIIKAEARIKEGEKRLKLSSRLAAGFIVIAAMASVYSFNQFREADIAKTEKTQLEIETNIAKTEKTQLERETQKLKNQTKDLELKIKTVNGKINAAEQNTKKAEQDSLAAKTKLEQLNKETESKIKTANDKTANDKTKAAQQNTKKAEQDLLAGKTKLEQLNKETESKIKTANDNIKAAQKKVQQAKTQQQQAEIKNKLAQEDKAKLGATLQEKEKELAQVRNQATPILIVEFRLIDMILYLKLFVLITDETVNIDKLKTIKAKQTPTAFPDVNPVKIIIDGIINIRLIFITVITYFSNTISSLF
jgi:DNA repair exonuclease SbcCD ATPase subunit